MSCAVARAATSSAQSTVPAAARVARRIGGMSEPPASAHEVQHVADDRPSRLARNRVLPENPVREQFVERAVLALEIDPRVDEAEQRLVAAGDDVHDVQLQLPRLTPVQRDLRMY